MTKPDAPGATLVSEKCTLLQVLVCISDTGGSSNGSVEKWFWTVFTSTNIEKVSMKMNILTVQGMCLTRFDYIFVRNTYFSKIAEYV